MSPATDAARLASFLESGLADVLRALRGSSVEELRIEHDGTSLALSRALPDAVEDGHPTFSATHAEAEDVAGPTVQDVRAQMVGVFHHARDPDGAPLALVDEHVAAGRAIGVIETLGVASDVEAPSDGRLIELLADGEPVEYGQTVAVIAPD
jgi:biotin carboxyl carrier protein